MMTDSGVPVYIWSDLVTLEELAHGTTTKVYSAKLNSTPVAVKILHTRQSDVYETAAEDLRNEARRNTGLRHPNIVQFLGLVQAPTNRDPQGLIFELADGKLSCVEYGSSRWREGVRIVLGISRALAYAHSLGLVHRDVKPSQVLMVGTRAKLGDWGLSRVVAEGMTSETGTWEYMAPEVIRGEQYDNSVDVYSLGILLYVITRGIEYPYEAEFLTPAQAAMGVAKHGLRPKTTHLKEGIKKIVEECWKENDRPKIAEVIQWLEGVLRGGSAKSTWYNWMWA